jgi:D-alanyl-D-alanine carboxypeptidase
MTHRQAALAGGLAAVGVALLVAATVTVMARWGQEPAPQVPVPEAPQTQQDGAPLEPATTTASWSAPSESKPFVVSARSYVVEDLSTGEILASRESQVRWPLASITKLMAAAVALERIPIDAPVLVVPVPGGNPSSPGIPVGSTFTMKDVLDVMLVASSNEAAESLAAHVGRDEFIAAMNAKAVEWGMTKTIFQDASGLSAGNQSTAREVVLLAAKVREFYPQVFAATARGSVTVHAASSSMPYTAYATHQLVRDPGFLGGKTGYTDEARGNLLSLFRIGGRDVAFVVLGSEQRFADTRGLRATLNTPNQ